MEGGYASLKDRPVRRSPRTISRWRWCPGLKDSSKKGAVLRRRRSCWSRVPRGGGRRAIQEVVEHGLRKVKEATANRGGKQFQARARPPKGLLVLGVRRGARGGAAHRANLKDLANATLSCHHPCHTF